MAPVKNTRNIDLFSLRYMEPSNRVNRITAAVAGVAGWTAWLWFVAVLGYQAFYWLKTAEWRPLPFSAFVDYFGIDMTEVFFRMSWSGLASIMLWIFDLPMSVMVPVLIFLVSAAVLSWVEQSQNRQDAG